MMGITIISFYHTLLINIYSITLQHVQAEGLLVTSTNSYVISCLLIWSVGRDRSNIGVVILHYTSWKVRYDYIDS